MKYLIFSEDIYDCDTLVWCADKEYHVTFENDELYYVTSEISAETHSVEKKSEGSLFDIVLTEE